ncbi:multicopper oxidase, type 2 [Granulicella sibirica]|uniref:Multicopper oxidase, type 2 n=1 Tax=Granulicella sibirica TaxID=2479048 RepID=A0A4Q0SZS9_9BACT|nr:multicopper oxidase, type 2 [Granulicella sibirica]
MLSITLEGANQDAAPVGQAQLPGRSNYFLGRDPSKWRKGVEQFSQARVKDVYDGIDLLYYGNGNGRDLEHDYVLAPGSDPALIRMRIRGGNSRIDDGSGDLIVRQGDGAQELMRLVRPVAYQTQADGSHKPVEARYTQNENGSFGFTLGTYDQALPLTIDPVVTYSTYFGGSNNDEVNDIKTDAAGNLVLLLATSSTDLPVVSQIANACVGPCGPLNPSPNGGAPRTYDFYLAKLDPTGQTLLYSTYIGGSGSDFPGALVIASDGTLYIAGTSDSTDFPVVNGYPSAIPDYRYYNSATLTKLSADGSTILYSSLIGAGLVEAYNYSAYSSAPGSLAVGTDGTAYVIGNACCGLASFLDAKNTTFTAGGGSFIAKFDTTKSGNDSLLYATTFGQPGDIGGENLQAIALDSKQNLWVAGEAYGSYASQPIPTPDAVQPVCDGGGQCGNAFLHGLTPAGTIFYTTFLGGTMNSGGGPGFETPIDLVIDSTDNIYLSGTTESVDYPIKNAAFTTIDTETRSNFLTKLSPLGKSILYSTYTPFVPLLATLANGEIAAVGNGIVPQVNAIPPNALTGEYNADIAFEVFDTTKAGMDSLLISSYLGSLALPRPEAASVDAQGNLLIAGLIGTNNFLLVNPYQSSCATCGYPDFALDGFVTRVQLASGSLTLTPSTQSFPDTPSGSSSPTQTSTLTNTTSATISLSAGSLTDANDFSESDNCNSSIASGASCTFTFTFKPQSAGALSSTYSISDVSNPSSPLTVALSGTGTTPPAPTAVLSPASADFSNIAAGSTSAAKTFTLTNSGNAALSITSKALAGADAGSFAIPDSNCGSSLAAGGSCAILVTYAPASAGTAAAMLTVTDAVGTQTAALTGTSFAAAPKATVTPASIDFQTFTLGIAGNPQTITLTNTGNTALPFNSFAITGTNASSFQVRNGGCPKSLAAGAACPIDVIFTPATVGTFVASLTFTDSLGTQSATLTGKAVYASATLVPAPGSPTNFGDVTVGAQAVSAIRVNNTSQESISVTGVSITGTGFTATGGGSCSGQIAPNSLCEVSVTFSPTALGAAAGTLSVTTDYAGTLTLNVTGNGIEPTATLDPVSYNFGKLPLNTSSGPIPFTLTNTSPVPIKLITSSVTGSAFHLAAKAGTLAPGASGKYLVAFEPTALGVTNGILSVVSDAGTFTSTLTGTGLAPQATLTPTTKDFGNVTVAGESPTDTFSLTNAGTAPLSISSIALTGASSTGFVISENQCGTSLDPGTSCTIGVTFLPTQVGQVVATLAVVDSVGTQSAALTAVGVLPVLTLTPPRLNFGAVTVGTTVTNSITYANNSPVSIQFKSQTGTGDFYKAFNQSGDGTCTPRSGGLNITSGGSCVYQFSFTPTAAANYFGALILTDTAGTQTIYFTGQGVPPTLNITPTTVSFGDVAVGSTASQTVTFTNASAGPISFSGNATPSGDFGTVFTPALTGNTCAGNAIAAGASCTLAFSFAPTATAHYSGDLSFTDDAGTQTLTFTGTGVYQGPKLVLSPTTYTFGAVPAGSTPTETVTLTNAGSEDANFVYGSSVASNGLQIAATGNTCGTTLAPGASCTIPVQLTGADTGSAQLTIDIAGNSGTNSVAASLIGFGATGGPPPTFIDLGNGFTTGALALNGPAAAANGVLQLTADQASQTSSAFYSTPVSATTFSTDFAFQLLDPLAEGLTFTIQSNGANAIGTGGGGLGYQGIAKSIALKLDLHDTAGEGDNSTGIYVNGAAPTVPATSLAGSGIDLHSGHVFTLHIDYDGATESIILTDTATQAVWKTQAAEDIPTLLGSDTAYFGFTASTEATAPDAGGAKPLAAAANATANTTTSILDWTYTTAPSPATLTPASLDFGTHVVGGLSPNQSAILTNTGVAPIQVVSVTPSDPQIQIPGGSGNCIGTLTPGQTCGFSPFYSPFVTGPFSGSVTVKYFLGDGTKANENFIASVKVTGTGVPLSLVRISPFPADFGTVSVNQTGSPQLFTVVNDGGEATTLSGITTTGAFKVVSGATCISGTSLGSLKSCTVPVVFAPGSLGANSGTLSLSYTDTDDPGKTQMASTPLTGIGSPELTFSPSLFDFGTVTVGSRAAAAVTLTNPSTLPLIFTGESFPDSPFYSYGGNCDLVSLAPGASCTLYLGVYASVKGDITANLILNYIGGSTIIPLIVHDVAPVVSVTSPHLDFGNVTAGSRAGMTVTLTATVGPIEFMNVAGNPMKGDNNFYITSDTCDPVSLPSGASCTIDFGVYVGEAEDVSGSYTLSYQGGATTITFIAHGVTPIITVTPNKLDFGDVMVGSRAGVTAGLTATLGPIQFINYHANPLSGDPSFYINSDTCDPVSLPSGTSCTIDFGVYVDAVRDISGSFTLNYQGGSTTIPLIVHGVPATAPDFTVTTTNASLNVIRGSSAKLVIDLGPSNANPFTAPVSFTASGLPAGATATFAPSTLTPGTGTSTTMTVSVPALAARNKPFAPFPPGGRNAAFGISAAALIAGLFGFRRRLNPRLLLCLCALSLIGAITGCGSGAGFTIPTTNSNFTVTATSGSITHTISVTLTVQ